MHIFNAVIYSNFGFKKMCFAQVLNNVMCYTHLLRILKSVLVKPVLSGHSKRTLKIGFQYQLTLNAGQRYCRMLQESILQYFQPSLSYHLSLRPLLYLSLSGRLRQVLLYRI